MAYFWPEQIAASSEILQQTTRGCWIGDWTLLPQKAAAGKKYEEIHEIQIGAE